MEFGALLFGVAQIATGIGAVSGAATIAGGLSALGVVGGGAVAAIVGGGATYLGANAVIDGLKGEFDLPVIQYTPFAIFSNQIAIFDINFFNPNSYFERIENTINTLEKTDEGRNSIEYNILKNEYEKIQNNEIKSSAAILQKAVSSAYQTCRLIAVVGLLSILVYIGIRIMLGSAAADKAKYKERLKDWLVAMCLVFVIHYIMVAIVTTCQAVSEQLASVCQEKYIVSLPSGTQVKASSEVLQGLNILSNYGVGINNSIGEDDAGNTGISENGVANLNTTTAFKLVGQKIAEDYFKVKNGAADAELINMFNEVPTYPDDYQYYTKYFKNIDVLLDENDDDSGMIGKFLRRIAENVNDTSIYSLYNGFATYESRLQSNGYTIPDSWREFYEEVAEIEGQYAWFNQEEYERIYQEQFGEKVAQSIELTDHYNYDGVDEEWITLEGDPNDNGRVPYATNFMGYIRLMIEQKADNNDLLLSVGYVIIYLALVILTIIFSVIYLKRVVYMAFLTMIAPLVAMTYPLDKIHDGKAQGFTMWIREYIFNALMQPLHLMLYTMVIGTVMSLAKEYPVYAVVALGFMIPAEKFVRQIFGFNKASTPAGMGAVGLAGTGLLMSSMNKLLHRPPRKDDDESQDDTKIKFRKPSGDLIGDGSPSDVSETVPNAETSRIRTSNVAGTANNILQGGEERTSVSEEERAIPRVQTTEQIQENSGVVSTAPTSRTTVQVPKATPQKRTLKSKIKDGAAYALMVKGNRYKRMIKKAHPIRKIRRAATYGVGAAALGMVGIAAGVASGDPGKAFSYGAAGAHLGGTVTKNIGNAIAADTRADARAFREGFEDEDAKIRRVQNRMAEDPDRMKFFRQKDPQNYREIMSTVNREYVPYGVTDQEKGYALYKAANENGWDTDHAIQTYKLAKRTGDIYNSPDLEEKWTKTIMKELENNENVQRMVKEQINKEFKDREKKIKAITDQAERKQQMNQLKVEKEDRAVQIRDFYTSRMASNILGDVKEYWKNT